MSLVMDCIKRSNQQISRFYCHGLPNVTVRDFNKLNFQVVRETHVLRDCENKGKMHSATQVLHRICEAWSM